MFLLNSQIPRATHSSSMLEPILLPKLHIYFADFPYRRYLKRFCSKRGPLMRWVRLVCVFCIGTDIWKRTASPRNNPHHMPAGSAIPTVQNAHPSFSSRLTAHKHGTIIPSPSAPSSHPDKSGTLVHTQVAFLLLPPRSARIAPPPPLTQDLRQNNAALLPSNAGKASDANSIPSIFPRAQFGRYVATRFLAAANLHGHRPTVKTRLPGSLLLA